MWTWNDASRYILWQMSANFWTNIVVFKKDGCCRRSFAPAIEEEIRVEANPKRYIVLSGEITVRKLLPIDRHFRAAQRTVMDSVKDV
jgi:hypothetical protein